MSIGNQPDDFIDFILLKKSSLTAKYTKSTFSASWRIRWIRTQSTQSQKHMDHPDSYNLYTSQLINSRILEHFLVLDNIS